MAHVGKYATAMIEVLFCVRIAYAVRLGNALIIIIIIIIHFSARRLGVHQEFVDI